MPPEPDYSITTAIGELKKGRSEYLTFLWKRYEKAMHKRARVGLGGSRGPNLDQEEHDVANAALLKFWNGVIACRWTQLENRNDLWRLMDRIIEFTANDTNEKALAQKRDARKQRRETDLNEHDNSGVSLTLDQLAAHRHDPADEVARADLFGRLLDALSDPTHRRILLLELAGYSVEEISAELDIPLTSLRRYRRLIIARAKELFRDESL